VCIAVTPPTVPAMSDIGVQPFAGSPPPTILASSVLANRVKPRHASIATQSETVQLAKQDARRQLRQQQRRRLPITQEKYLKQASPVTEK